VSTHRREVKPRYGRIVSLAIAVTVSAVAALAGLGVLATAQAGPSAKPASYHHVMPSAHQSDQQQSDQQQSDAGGPSAGSTEGSVGAPQGTSNSADSATVTALPADSGHGRRIVFSQSRQRVWLVGGDKVDRTYLVSGSVYDNLDPGAFNVYSRSEDAWGVDDSGSMKYFVRFTQGDTGAAIGFHDIPIKDGVPAQTEAQLGTPLSHGCVRQRRSDAIALWKFAPLGTSVIVTA